MLAILALVSCRGPQRAARLAERRCANNGRIARVTPALAFFCPTGLAAVPM